MRSVSALLRRPLSSLPARLFWDIHSFTWDDVLQLPNVWEAIARQAARLIEAGARRGERVIDVGCGTGNYSIALGRLGFDVVGVDYSPGMLARAREKTDGELSVRFDRADATKRLPYADQSFDHAICFYALQVISDPSAVVREIRRVLKRGGLFLLIVPSGAIKIMVGTTLPKRLFWKFKAAVVWMGSHLYRFDDDLPALVKASRFEVITASRIAGIAGIGGGRIEILARAA